MIPLLLVSLVVALSATIVAVWAITQVLGRWTEETLRQASENVATHFEERRSVLASHATLIARDERLAAAIREGKPRGRGGPLDARGAWEYLAAAREALAADNVALVGPDGRVVANSGVLTVSTGDVLLAASRPSASPTAAPLTALAPVADRESINAMASVKVDGGEYTVVLSDVVTPQMLGSSFAGLGAAFAYFDGDGRLVARFVDQDALGPRASQLLAGRIVATDRDVASALAHPGEAFQSVVVDGRRYLMLARALRSPAVERGRPSVSQVLVVASTDIEDRAGDTTRGLMILWSVLGAAMLAGFGLVVSRRISAPIVSLSENARRVADGDFTHVVPAYGENEIGDLAESFNQMTDSLRQRTDAITKKVLELATLYEMSRQLGSTLEIDTLLDSVLDSALRIFDVDAGYIVLRDRDTERMGLRAWRNESGERPDERALLSSMSEWVVREARPLIYNPPADPSSGEGHVDGVTGASAALCVPLVSNEGIIGAVTVGSHDPSFRFGGADVRLLSTIANHATIAIGNIELFSSLQEAYIATVRSLAAAVDAKDPFTRGHSDRVAEYANAIAEDLDLSSEQRTALEMAAYLHDIGKIGISEDILLKPGRLLDDEIEQMRHHPLIGANILRPVAFPWAIAPIVRHHHERWDGKGYPAGLRGEEIPLLARILTVADAYEAMTSNRPYRSSRTEDEALEELKRCAGAQFDPRIVDAFATVLEDVSAQRDAIQAELREEVEADEARAIFVAVCDGMLGAFRRLGGPRLAANLEAEMNRWFVSEEAPFSFSAGRLSGRWEDGEGGPAEIVRMRAAIRALADAMGRTSGESLVDGFYAEAVSTLSSRMRLLAERLELYRRA